MEDREKVDWGELVCWVGLLGKGVLGRGEYVGLRLSIGLGSWGSLRVLQMMVVEKRG